MHTHLATTKKLIADHDLSNFTQFYEGIRDPNVIAAINKECIPLAISVHGIVYSEFLQAMVNDTKSFALLLAAIIKNCQGLPIKTQRRKASSCIKDALKNIPEIDIKHLERHHLMNFSCLADKESFYLAKEKGLDFDGFEGAFVYCSLFNVTHDETFPLSADDIHSLGYTIDSDRKRWLTNFSTTLEGIDDHNSKERVFCILADLKKKGLQGLSSSSIKMLMQALSIENPIDYLSQATEKEAEALMNLLSE